MLRRAVSEIRRDIDFPYIAIGVGGASDHMLERRIETTHRIADGELDRHIE